MWLNVIGLKEHGGIQGKTEMLGPFTLPGSETSQKHCEQWDSADLWSLLKRLEQEEFTKKELINSYVYFILNSNVQSIATT